MIWNYNCRSYSPGKFFWYRNLGVHQAVRTGSGIRLGKADYRLDVGGWNGLPV